MHLDNLPIINPRFYRDNEKHSAGNFGNGQDSRSLSINLQPVADRDDKNQQFLSVEPIDNSIVARPIFPITLPLPFQRLSGFRIVAQTIDRFGNPDDDFPIRLGESSKFFSAKREKTTL